MDEVTDDGIGPDAGPDGNNSHTTPPATPAGTDWEAKYNGLRGAMQQARTRATNELALVQGELEIERAKVAEAVEQAATHAQTITELQEQLGVIPTLQEEVSKVSKLEAVNQRLSTLLQHPRIVNAATVVEVEAEDGTKTQKTENAILNLLMTSSLEGDEWANQVTQIESRLVAPDSKDATVIMMSDGVGGPNNPDPVDTPKQAMMKEMLAAKDEGDYAKASRLISEMAKLDS